jgi:hypothetical protein
MGYHSYGTIVKMRPNKAEEATSIEKPKIRV